MSELTDEYDNIRRKRRFDFMLGRILAFSFVLLIVVAVGCSSFYFLIVPATTGQQCLDIASGHVPDKAKVIFLDKVFNAIVMQNYEWLSTVSTERVLNQIKEIQPLITKDYEVVGGDDLAGMYERDVLFDNGVQIYLVFWGSWSCPDFVITEEEVFHRLKLAHLEKR